MRPAEPAPKLGGMGTNVQQASELPSSEWPRLSWKEICARYPDEWVFLVHVEYEDDDMDSGEIVRAVVLGHAKNSRENYLAVKPIVEREDIMMSSHLYTGEPIPTDLRLPML